MSKTPTAFINKISFKYYALKVQKFIAALLHLTLVFGIVGVLLFYIDVSRDLIIWRAFYISVPMYQKIIGSKYFQDKYKHGCMDQTTYASIVNTYKLHMDWAILLIFMIVIFAVWYIYRYYTTRRGYGSLLYVRLYGLFVLILVFLCFYDSFFANVIKDFDTYQILHGWPSFDTQVPFYKYFVHSEFLQHFRTWIGYGNIFFIPESYHKYTFAYDIPKLDKENLWGFHGLPKELYAERLRTIVNEEIFPDLREVVICKNNVAYYNNKYQIVNLYELDFLPAEIRKLLSPEVFGEYSFGLALACIVFIIAMILSALYLLNFLTSVSAKDAEKLSPYECGFDPMHTNARIKFDVLYWIIGILYLIFDLEIIFIFPLATILQTLQSPVALLAYLFFMIILTLGFIYEWKKGALKLKAVTT